MTTSKKTSRHNWRLFEEARSFVRDLGLRNKDEWLTWSKSDARLDEIPIRPDAVYTDQGWISWGDWLGTDRIPNQNRVWRPFEEAREFVHSLRLKNQDDWIAWAKSKARPDDIPAKPRNVYKDVGWVSMGDWLGTGNLAPQNMIWRPFDDAREFVRTLNLDSKSEWVIWARSAERPQDVPISPSRVYAESGWIGWGDWLGTGRIANQNKTHRSFPEARAFASGLGLAGQGDWRDWVKSGELPDDIPSNPNVVYKGKGWVSWGDWLNTGRIANTTLSDQELILLNELL